MRYPTLILVVSLSSALGCSKPAEAPRPAELAPAVLAAPVAAAPTAKAERFGAALSEAAPMTLASVLASPKDHAGKTVKVSGRVSGVCQKKGCWMTLVPPDKTDATPVRISFKDYGFFVPMSIMGKQVLAEGVFEVKVLPQAQAQHFADDAVKPGEKPQKIVGDQQTLALVATGVEVVQ